MPLGNGVRGAARALGLDQFHLVVHDTVYRWVSSSLRQFLSGPSLTVLDTLVEVDTFKTPLVDGAVRAGRYR